MLVLTYNNGIAIHTVIADILLSHLRVIARVRRPPVLQFQRRARLAEAFRPKGIHSAVQRAVFPAKEVVAVGTIASAISSQQRNNHLYLIGRKNSRIAKAVHERLLAVRVVLRISEAGCIVHNLVHDLRDANRMRARASIACQCCACGVGHVCFVIWTIEVLSIPAGREDDCSADTAWTRFAWEVG